MVKERPAGRGGTAVTAEAGRDARRSPPGSVPSPGPVTSRQRAKLDNPEHPKVL